MEAFERIELDECGHESGELSINKSDVTDINIKIVTDNNWEIEIASVGAWIELENWIVDAWITLIRISTEAFLALTCTGCAFPLVTIVKYIDEIVGSVTFSHVQNEVIKICKFLTEISDNGIVESVKVELVK